MDAGSSFNSPSTIVDNSEMWVIPITQRMPLQMEYFGDSEGDNKKTVRWSLYIEELDSSNFSNFETILTESGSVGKEGRFASPVRILVLDGTECNYIFPAVLSYISSNGEKNEGKPWNCD